MTTLHIPNCPGPVQVSQGCYRIVARGACFEDGTRGCSEVSGKTSSDQRVVPKSGVWHALGTHARKASTPSSPRPTDSPMRQTRCTTTISIPLTTQSPLQSPPKRHPKTHLPLHRHPGKLEVRTTRNPPLPNSPTTPPVLYQPRSPPQGDEHARNQPIWRKWGVLMYSHQAQSAAECNGLWRSLVAHLTGGQVVAGSNPVSPTVVKPSPTSVGEGFLISHNPHSGTGTGLQIRDSFSPEAMIQMQILLRGPAVGLPGDAPEHVQRNAAAPPVGHRTHPPRTTAEFAYYSDRYSPEPFERIRRRVAVSSPASCLEQSVEPASPRFTLRD